MALRDIRQVMGYQLTSDQNIGVMELKTFFPGADVNVFDHLGIKICEVNINRGNHTYQLRYYYWDERNNVWYLKHSHDL